MRYQIKDVHALRVLDNQANRVFIGGDQDWYPTEWQRRSGCGPTTVTNIIAYLTRDKNTTDTTPFSKETYVAMMEDVWNYVTPTRGGIPTANLLLQGVSQLMEAKGYQYRSDYVDIIPSENSIDGDVVKNFLIEHIRKDIPVALLTLDIGNEPALDEWHWVTIVGVDGQENDITVEIVDCGEIKQANLGLWLSTTNKGGGLAGFSIV